MQTTSDPYMLTLHTSLTESNERQHHRSVIGSISRLISVGDYMPANCYHRLTSDGCAVKYLGDVNSNGSTFVVSIFYRSPTVKLIL